MTREAERSSESEGFSASRVSMEPVPLYAPPEPPAFRKEGLGWTWEPPDTPLRFRVDYLHRKSGELHGQVTVTSGYPGTGTRHLVEARYNLSVDTARSRLAGYLRKQLGTELPAEGAPNFDRLVEVFCVKVSQAQHQGGGVLLVGDLEEPPYAPDLVQKLIEAGAITSLYGPQGEGKGWLGIKLAVCVQAGIPFCGLRVRQAHVLYLDWEADRWVFQRRVKAVCRGMGLEQAIPIRWYRPPGTIMDTIHYVAEYVQQERIGLVIWDSVGHASGSPVDYGGGWEGLAIQAYDCAALMGEGVSHLWIDHLSAAGIKDKVAGKSSGAIRKMADSRVAWEIRKAQTEESDRYSIGLFHTKFNNTKMSAPLGFRLGFESDAYGRATAVTFEREDVVDTDNVERLPIGQRITALLRRGALETGQIAEHLDISQASVRTHCTRLASRGELLRLGSTVGGKTQQRWGLAAGVTPLRKNDVTRGGLQPPPRVPQQQAQQGVTVTDDPPNLPVARLPYAEDDEGEEDDRDGPPF